MATSGPNQGSSAAENDTFDAPWTNIANAVSQDSSYATNGVSGPTNGLDVIGFGTFTGIGAGDSVTHIQIEVRCFVDTDTNLPELSTACLLLSGSTRGDVTPVTVPVTTSVAYVNPGSQTVSAFGTTLIGSQVNDATFGVRLVFSATDSGQTLSVDAVRVTLTYSSGITGTASITQAANTISASGSVSVVGAASITQAANTISATGVVASASSAMPFSVNGGSFQTKRVNGRPV